MNLPSAFISPATISRIAIDPRRAIGTRTRKMLCLASQGSDNVERKNEDSFSEVGRLPPGSTSSKATNKADLGFVGAERIGISFICTAENCNTRIVKSVRRSSYEKGTVVIQCPSCTKYHVIADNTGMYSSLTGGKANIEEIAKAKGQSVTRVDNTVFNLENVLGMLDADYSPQINRNCRTADSRFN